MEISIIQGKNMILKRFSEKIKGKKKKKEKSPKLPEILETFENRSSKCPKCGKTLILIATIRKKGKEIRIYQCNECKYLEEKK